MWHFQLGFWSGLRLIFWFEKWKWLVLFDVGRIYIKDLLAQGAESGAAQLPPNKYNVVAEDLTYVGELEVAVVFTRKVFF